MTDAIIAGRAPHKIDLEAGKKYAWCRCGRSQSQPFCDGSHKDTGLSPEVFSVDEAKTAHLCMCKRSANAPFCDGAHNSLE